MKSICFALLAIALALGASCVPRSTGALASYVHGATAKKACKTVTKMVKGKKKRVKVCRTAKAAPSRFAAPGGLAVGSDGNLYVLDAEGSAAVMVLAPSGNTVRSWGSHGSGRGQIENPRFLALDSTGNVYITQANWRVQKFSGDGAFLRAWGSYGRGPGQFDGVAGIAVGKDGTVYVSDGFNSRIQKFSPGGAYLGEIAVPSDNPGNASRPIGVAVDPQGSIVVASFDSGRVDRLAPDGKRLASFRVDGPRSVAVDPQGNIYVTTGFPGAGNYLEKLSPDGTPVARWAPGVPYDPDQVAVDAQGNVYVSEGSYQSPGPAPAIIKLSPSLQVLATWK
jgi:DNA-binding beta-propeller fold protein YncE